MKFNKHSIRRCRLSRIIRGSCLYNRLEFTPCGYFASSSKEFIRGLSFANKYSQRHPFYPPTIQQPRKWMTQRDALQRDRASIRPSPSQSAPRDSTVVQDHLPRILRLNQEEAEALYLSDHRRLPTPTAQRKLRLLILQLQQVLLYFFILGASLADPYT